MFNSKHKDFLTQSYFKNAERQENGEWKNSIHYSVYMIFKSLAVTMDSKQSSNIVAFYKDCNVLITGGTGFLGKLLLQKFLRTCPDIKGIYLIIREKKGKTSEQRVDETFNNALFHEMKKVVPNYRDKIHAIPGDINYENIGLHTEDREMLIDKINVIIHGGATLNFAEKLKQAVDTNIRGTRDILKLAEEMKHLKCMMYVSSAYSNCNYLTITESFYRPPLQPDTLIKLVAEVSEDVLEKMTPQMLDGWPNTYSYTKAVAEQLIREKIDVIPIGMIRPSMIGSIYKDPLRCWTDNVYGPNGYGLGCGLGVTHIIRSSPEIQLDSIPGDYAINTLLAAIPDVVKQFEEKSYRKNIIYNCAATTANAYTVGEYMDKAEKYHTLAFTNSIYKNCFIMTNCRVYELILRVILHYIPAILIDIFSLLTGKSPKMFALYKTIHKFTDSVTYFASRTFDIKNDNTVRLWNEQNDVDKEIFPFNMQNFDWDDYFKYFSLGMKQYFLKDKMDEESIQAAITKYRRLDWIHRIVKTLFYTGCAYLFWIIFNMFK